MNKSSLNIFNISVFLKTQIFLLPVLFLFYLDNGLNTSDYFLFQGIIVLINVFLQIPIGLISNYISRKKLIIVSYLIYMGRIFLWIFFKGYIVVLLGEIFYAVSKSIFDAVEAPYIYQVLKNENKESNMLKSYSSLNVALCLGTGVASILGVVLYKYCGVKILLLTEFLIINIAVVLTKFIPRTEVNKENYYSLDKFKDASKYIFISGTYLPCILYSGFLAAFSHFFFWSFQPLLKSVSAPVYLFGIIIFVNNAIRALSSCLSEKISDKIKLSTHGLMSFVFNTWAFVVFAIYFYALQRLDLKACIAYILFLCVCIGFQLSFTIRQTSYIQQKSDDNIRGYVASVNMMIMRIFIGLILILPKVFEQEYEMYFMFVVYFIAFLSFGTILLFKFLKSFNFKNIKKSFFVMLFVCVGLFTIFVEKSIASKKVINFSYKGRGDGYVANHVTDELLKRNYRKLIDGKLYKSLHTKVDYNISIIGHFNTLKCNNQNKNSRFNIMWLLHSHLGINSNGIEKKVIIDEYVKELMKHIKKYDAVIVSSKKIYDMLNGKIETPLYYIPQFTDTNYFYPDYDVNSKSKLLFIGFPHFRRIAPFYAINNGLPITMYGCIFKNNNELPGEYIDNNIVRRYYSSAVINLNDTLPSMNELGFISGRIYDVSASGGFIISDYSKGTEEVFGDSVPMYKNEEEFVKLVDFYLRNPRLRLEKAKKAREIALNYTNEKIVTEFEKIFQDLESKETNKFHKNL